MNPAAKVVIFGALSTLGVSTNVYSQDQIEFVSDPLQSFTPDTAAARRWLPNRLGQQRVPAVADLEKLLALSLDPTHALVKDKNFYCVIHLVASGESGPAQAWFLYRGGGSWSQREITGQRLFGAMQLGLLYVYLDAPDGAPTYKISVTRKVNTPLQNLGGLLQFATTRRLEGQQPAQWGGRVLRIRFKTSDISIEALLSSPRDTVRSLGKQTYDNEGLTWWDVSVGVPVRAVEELNYSSQSGVVTATNVEREKAYALLDLYPVPVDPRSNRFQLTPLVVGVSLADKPFDHLLAATGLGYKAIHVFVGAAFNNDHRPKTLRVGDSATQAQVVDNQATHYVAKFAFGLNISVTQVLGGAKTASSSAK